MKRALHVLLFILTIASTHAQQPEPRADAALILIQLQGSFEDPIMVTLISEKVGKGYPLICRPGETAAIFIPLNDSYRVKIPGITGSDILEIPDTPYYQLGYAINLPEITHPNGLLRFSLETTEGKPLKEIVQFKGKKNGKTFKGITTEDGELEIILEPGITYEIGFDGAPFYDVVEIPDDPLIITTHTTVFNGSGPGKHYPRRDSALFMIRFNDLDGNPAPQEIITVTDKASGQSFKGVTNAEGIAYILAPLGCTFGFSGTHFQALETYKVSPEEGLYTFDLTIEDLTTFQWNERIRKRKRQIAVRDSLARHYSAMYTTEEENLADALTYWTSKAIIQSEAAREGLHEDSKFFEKTKQVVNSVFYRMREKWKNKMIVFDITCSMDPYADELMVWTLLKQSINEDNQYLFFNDGNGLWNEMKVIGHTGGFHHTTQNELDSILVKMYQAKKYGCSGDSPENDLEALLEGAKLKRRSDELILVADNYSDVRDIELLENLDVPVRIILCGADHEINGQYLDIARKTKGSVHTIEEDILNLSDIAEGKEIVIDGKSYLLKNGRFIFK
jgi:hypothetical protein